MFRATWLFAIFNGENTTIPTSAKKYKVDCQICYLFRVLNFAFFIRKTYMLNFFCMRMHEHYHVTKTITRKNK
jgi:hypothetical protein